MQTPQAAAAPPPGRGRLTIIGLDIEGNAAARAQLEEIARVSGGTVMAASDTAALAQAFRRAVSAAPPAGPRLGGGPVLPRAALGADGIAAVASVAVVLTLALALVWRLRSRR
jgi:hypothetical protein